MDELLSRLKAFDLQALVVAARMLPLWAGATLSIVGLMTAFAGGHKYLSRVIFAGLGAGLGLYAGPLLAPLVAPFVPQIPQGMYGFGLAGVLGTIGGISPAALCFVVAGSAGGYAGWRLVPTEEAFLGVAPGVVLIGGAAAVLWSLIARVLSAGAGGLAVSVGLTSVLLGTELAPWAQNYPIGLLLLGLVVAIGGAAFQLTRPPPEEQKKIEGERAVDKAQVKQRKEDEKRWDKYTKATSSND